jgi:hypothetical protein
MAKNIELTQARQSVLENLEQIQVDLSRCIGEGMVDSADAYYNEVLGLIEDARTVDNWDELNEAITRSKTLENEIAGWMSRHGRTTLSLPWPKKIKY